MVCGNSTLVQKYHPYTGSRIILSRTVIKPIMTNGSETFIREAEYDYLERTDRTVETDNGNN